MIMLLQISRLKLTLIKFFHTSAYTTHYIQNDCKIFAVKSIDTLALTTNGDENKNEIHTNTPN